MIFSMYKYSVFPKHVTTAARVYVVSDIIDISKMPFKTSMKWL